jgi:hypothetical protein
MRSALERGGKERSQACAADADSGARGEGLLTCCGVAGTRERHTVPLPPRQVHALLADLGVVACGTTRAKCAVGRPMA